jgi:holo-[acyl-carrier protein] synthase
MPNEATLSSAFEAAAAATARRLQIRTPHGAVASGCDLVYLPEFQDRVHPRFLARAYTDDEIAECRDRFDSVTAFAARWAAKEAAYKAFCQLADAFQAPRQGLAVFRHYEVAHLEGSRIPGLRFHGRPAAFLSELRAASAAVHVSLTLTHDGDYAAAFAVIGVELAPPAYLNGDSR